MPAIFQPLAEFARHFWEVLAEMSPYLLFGFLVAGILSEILPRKFVERHLSGGGPWPSVKASLLGIPLPLCSCGVIPVAASIRKTGASRGATVSFLLSTPQTGVDSIMITWSLLGPLFTFYRVVVAFITGVGGGWLVDWLAKDPAPVAAAAVPGHDPATCTDPHCHYCNGAPDHPPVAGAQAHAHDHPGAHAACSDGCCGSAPETAPEAKRPPLAVLGRMLRYGFITLPRDIARALAIGLLIAGAITTLVPHDFFANQLGGWAWLEYLVMLGIGIPMYVCATASVPVAAALIAAGISPGAAFVFLVTGPATNGATIATIWQVLGRRTALLYLGTVTVGALAAGVLLDRLYVATNTPKIYHSHFMLPLWFTTGCALALVLLLAVALFPTRRKPREIVMNENEVQTKLKVQGMTCSHCEATVTRVLSEQAGVKQVQVDLKGGIATVVGAGYDLARLLAALADAGYPAQPA